MIEWVEKVERELESLAVDLHKLSAKKGKSKSDTPKKAQLKGQKGLNISKDEHLKSFQKLTTFYSDETEAREIQKEDPITIFIDKRMREIFEG